VNKTQALDWAETIDSYRVFPRFFLLVCLGWAIALNYELIRWYMNLPSVERSVEASGFASIVFVAVMGFLKMVYTTYSENGRNWNEQPARTTTTSAVTSSTVVNP